MTEGFKGLDLKRNQVMGSCYEESLMVVKRDAPVPPPLPTTARPSMAVLRRRSCCASVSTTESWDRLFDDAYRADVSVLTSSDDIIYAHSSILVSSIIVLITCA